MNVLLYLPAFSLVGAFGLAVGCSDGGLQGAAPVGGTAGTGGAVSGAGANGMGIAGNPGATSMGGSGGGASAGAPGGGAMAGGTGGMPDMGAAGDGAGGALAGGGGAAGGQGVGGQGVGGQGMTEEPTDFTCTQVTGALLTGEWYQGGDFEPKLEALGGDPDKWELKNNHFGTIEKWSNPTEGPIQTNDGDSYYWGKEPSSPCAMNSNNPDRVIFTAISWEYVTEEEWTTALQAVVQNIKDKYSNIRWIELTSQARCPNNMMCNDNAVQGPGSNGSAPLQDCYVWPAQDAAMAAVAAADPIVGLTPQFEAEECRPEGIDGAHLGSANGAVAQSIAEWYAAHP